MQIRENNPVTKKAVYTKTGRAYSCYLAVCISQEVICYTYYTATGTNGIQPYILRAA